MPHAKISGPVGYAAQNYKRMRRLQRVHLHNLPLSEVTRAAHTAVVQLRGEELLRQGDVLLERMSVGQAEPEVAPDDELAELEPLTTD